MSTMVVSYMVGKNGFGCRISLRLLNLYMERSVTI